MTKSNNSGQYAQGNLKVIDSLLTVREVAELLRIDESTVYKWADGKRLPYIDLGKGKKRCLRFQKKDIENLIISCARGGHN